MFWSQNPRIFNGCFVAFCNKTDVDKAEKLCYTANAQLDLLNSIRIIVKMRCTMQQNTDLPMLVLLGLTSDNSKERTVTGIARLLKTEKYKVSRSVSELEKEGFVNRSDSRDIRLTEKGPEKAKQFQERVDVSMSHLLYEGMSVENAQHDAYVWSLRCTDEYLQDSVDKLQSSVTAVENANNRDKYFPTLAMRDYAILIKAKSKLVEKDKILADGVYKAKVKYYETHLNTPTYDSQLYHDEKSACRKNRLPRKLIFFALQKYEKMRY